MDHGKRKLSWKTVGSDIRSKVTIIIIKDSDSDKASTVSLMRLKGSLTLIKENNWHNENPQQTINDGNLFQMMCNHQWLQCLFIYHYNVSNGAINYERFLFLLILFIYLYY